MKRAAAVVGLLLIVVGLFGFAWPFPLFTLNEPYVTWYAETVLRVDIHEPGGAAAALPFLWIVTAPVGLAAAAVGACLLHWGKSK